jgi:endonuclease/exonuclease/phosphatase family metal-dependent hydrolase
MLGRPLRIATFNLESLDDDALTARIAALRPELVRLRADILCLQEVNGQRVARGHGRRLAALSTLISETPYATYQMVSTLTADGDPADVHNLVILSRLPIVSRAQIRHDLVERPLYRPATASPRSDRPEPIEWERPLLHAEIAVGTASLHVINLHLRAPLAAPVAGQKLGLSQPFREVAFCASYKCHCLGSCGSRLSWLCGEGVPSRVARGSS